MYAMTTNIKKYVVIIKESDFQKKPSERLFLMKI
jgi:hypothetical protein